MKQSNKAMAFNHKGIMEMAETVAEEARREEKERIVKFFRDELNKPCPECGGPIEVCEPDTYQKVLQQLSKEK